MATQDSGYSSQLEIVETPDVNCGGENSVGNKVSEIGGEYGIIAKLPSYKRGGDFNVCVVTYDGKVYVAFRYFYVDKKDGDYKPGKPGLMINVEQWNTFKDALAEIRQILLYGGQTDNLELGTKVFRTIVNKNGDFVLEGNRVHPFASRSSHIIFTYEALHTLCSYIWEIDLVIANKNRI